MVRKGSLERDINKNLKQVRHADLGEEFPHKENRAKGLRPGACPSGVKSLGGVRGEVEEV